MSSFYIHTKIVFSFCIYSDDIFYIRTNVYEKVETFFTVRSKTSEIPIERIMIAKLEARAKIRPIINYKL